MCCNLLHRYEASLIRTKSVALLSFQYRDVTCIVTSDGASSSEEEEVPASLCSDSGLVPRPDSVRDCPDHRTPCPRWVVREKWSRCQMSECVERNKGEETAV